MSKKIRLTWDNGKRQIVEECILLEEDVDELYVPGTDVKLTFDEVRGRHSDRVLFEDDDAVFALHAKQIIHIEELANED